jgi:hypothetical protein
MARAVSKSPARGRRGAPAAAEPADAAGGDDQTQLAIAVVVLVAVWFHGTDGNLSLTTFASSAKEGFNFDVPNPLKADLWTRVFGSSCNFVLTLHALNTIKNTAGTSGYWLNNFAQTVIAAFAGVIAPAVLKGGNTLEAVFADPSTHLSMFSFFSLWYVVNYNIPGCPAELNVWGTISNVGGEALNILLGFGTAMFTTNLVIAASSQADLFTSAWFVAVSSAIIAATAGSFFPLSKGFKLGNSDEAANAFAIAFFIGGNGFQVVDTVTNAIIDLAEDATLDAVDVPFNMELGAKLNTLVCDPFGGVGAFVVTVVALNHLFGDAVPMATRQGFDVFGVMDKVLNLIQL